MSSGTYSACLKPDRRLRIVVVATGVLLGVIGMLLIIALPLAVWLRLVCGAIWAAVCRVEMRRLRAGYQRYESIRLLAGGAVQLRNCDRQWVAARLQNGSVLLQRLAWLRFRLADGSQFAELISGNSRQCQQWRRLQVIWRHIGAAE